MADQWVCVECGHPTPIEPGGDGCPECGGKMEKIDDLDNDLEKDTYGKGEMETPLDDDIELPETDDEAEGDDEEEAQDESPIIQPKQDDYSDEREAT
ncbi:hypothetical protein A2215_01815 [Candidatus Berkelbacteria bacterium RIFOXYA2_FULL_43_10]|uniref:Rubredoxin-like domain-containing protein n=1 Tax=Candidatus Berkelbacteria bacterium RIFOXYA2_FULL_43_10 TaxID=1797472 RepID=A0A1F5E796_9BACT|nr:MAG: hypothetical protein A2215_01815 [Candidatus Berkelbacteria bacterium RIFOXYA2_FULL_43_10]